MKGLSESGFSRWKASSAKWRSKLEVPPSFKPWTERSDFKAVGVGVTERVADLLDCVCTEKLVKTKATCTKTGAGNSRQINLQELMSGTFVDVSQSHERKCFSLGHDQIPTITTSTILHSFSHDSVVHPSELFLWHGFPRTLAMPPSMTCMKSMIGNSMCAPCLGQAIVTLLCMLWTRPNPNLLSEQYQ